MKIVVIVHRVALKMVAGDVVREIYSRADGNGAVLVFEEESAEAVETHLKTLPLVEAGLLTYEIYPVTPYRAIVAAANA